jgi:lysozyme
MKPSPTILAFMCARETFQPKAMLPTPHDRPTFGFGQTFHLDGSPVKMGECCTRAEADTAFAARMVPLAAKVTALIGLAPTTQFQFDALLSLADNIGAGHDGLGGSTVLKLHVAGDYEKAAAWFKPWCHQGGIVLLGLVTRRASEASIYQGGKP